MQEKRTLEYTVKGPVGFNILHEGKGTLIRTDKKVFKNDPYPCGSGKRAKHCHREMVNMGKPLKSNKNYLAE